jgi:hypothetical protein
MWPRKRIAGVLLRCVQALLLAAVILLLMAYFGSHVRDAGGSVASSHILRAARSLGSRRQWTAGRWAST